MAHCTNLVIMLLDFSVLYAEQSRNLKIEIAIRLAYLDKFQQLRNIYTKNGRPGHRFGFHESRCYSSVFLEFMICSAS